MKTILLFLVLCSCNKRFCQPSPKSRDWTVTKIKGDTVFMTKYEVGLGFKYRTVYYECGHCLKVGSRVR